MVGALAVSDFVAVPADCGRTVSEVARVLSAPEALSGRVCCKLSVSGGWLSDAAGAVLSEAGTCPDAARGAIKRLNPSSHVARKVECRDITALRFELGATVVLMFKIAALTGRGATRGFSSCRPQWGENQGRLIGAALGGELPLQ